MIRVPGIMVKGSAGQRATVVHADGELQMISDSKSKLGNYCGDTNSTNYKKWKTLSPICHLVVLF
jgi:hypothetical protein